MGTRSHTYFYQDGKPFCAFYRQMDGYPNGHGVDLGEILAPITLVNGYQFGMKTGEYANGPGCLAAQVIARLKTDIGSIYMVSPNPDDHKEGWQDYEYHIHINTVGEDFNAKYVTSIDCTDTENVIFSGSFKQFLKWAKKPKVDANNEYVPVIHNPGKVKTKVVYGSLRAALKSETVYVKFEKADGRVRTMKCTLDFKKIPKEKHPANTMENTREHDENLYKVYDLEKSDWRSFREECIIDWNVVSLEN